MSDKQTVLNIMRNSSLNAYLLTSVNNQPHGRIVSPVIDDDLTVWVITFHNSRKISEINSNPLVTVTFNEYPNKGFREVQLFGKAQLVDDLETKKMLWETKKNSVGSYFKSFDDPNFALIKINYSQIEWADQPQSSKQIIQAE